MRITHVDSEWERRLWEFFMEKRRPAIEAHFAFCYDGALKVRWP